MLVVMAQIYLIELVLLACRLSCFQSSSNRFFLSGNSQHADLKASDGLFELPQLAEWMYKAVFEQFSLRVLAHSS